MPHPVSLDIEVPHLDRFYIGSSWVESASDATREVISPTTEQVLATVPEPSGADADLAVVAARQAFDTGPWSRMTMSERIVVGERLIKALEARMPVINRAWAFESGVARRHREALNGMMTPMVGRENLKLAASMSFEEIRESPAERALLSREPVGVVLAVLTYNGPVIQMTKKVLPALLAGNTVVIKPAPESQLTSRLLAESFADADFPPGVVNLVPGGTEASQHLVAHRGIDFITLTAGAEIGVDVLRRSASHMPRTVFELGGKGPAIVLADAELAPTAAALADGAMSFLGQICTAQSRIFVPRSRYDDFSEALGKAYSAMLVGDPFDDKSDFGPLAVERALRRTERFVESALRQGGTVVAGGRPPAGLDKGYFYEPTLIRDLTNDSDLCQNEVFGPVTALVAYDTVDEAVAAANGTRYGLLGSVFSADRDEAQRVAARVKCGMVAINHGAPSLGNPFGGVRGSGWGRECGPEGIYEFTQLKTTLLSTTFSMFES
jgi:aldehyde dehydrogenase (NAD+)